MTLQPEQRLSGAALVWLVWQWAHEGSMAGFVRARSFQPQNSNGSWKIASERHGTLQASTLMILASTMSTSKRRRAPAAREPQPGDVYEASYNCSEEPFCCRLLRSVEGSSSQWVVEWLHDGDKVGLEVRGLPDTILALLVAPQQTAHIVAVYSSCAASTPTTARIYRIRNPPPSNFTMV